jgi:hypothetical protein
LPELLFVALVALQGGSGGFGFGLEEAKNVARPSFANS